MKVLRDGLFEPGDQPSVVAIGVFDGLHLGHQRILARVLDLARTNSAVATVVTFDPHPALILAPESAPLQLASLDQRLAGLAALGIEQARVITFSDDLALESANSFVDRVLVRELHASNVVVGRDFRFGHHREGHVELLQRDGEIYDFMVHPTDIYGDEQRWSSSAVRSALIRGDLATAEAILGRAFALRGTVIHGDSRGTDLGYPTANMNLSATQQLPQLGVYAGAVRTADEQWWPAAIAVGTRPQFYENGPVLVEAHLPGFSGDLYDQVIDVVFLQHLRGEMMFENAGELVAQIDRDVEQSLEIFKKSSPLVSALLR